MRQAARLLSAVVVLALSMFFQTSRVDASGPLHVVITNLRDASFNVSWLTAVAESGQIRLDRGDVYQDKRGADFNGVTHYVTVSGLEPDHDYSFDVISGGKLSTNGDAHWTLHTGTALASRDADVIVGEIRDPEGAAPTDAIVFAMIGRPQQEVISAPLTTLVTAADRGVFSIDLGQARTWEGPGRFFEYSINGDRYMNNNVTLQVVSSVGTGSSLVDMADARLRTSNPEQRLVLQLSPDSGMPWMASLASGAKSDPSPVTVSNVDDSSFTVSWRTEHAETGQVRLVDGAIYDDGRGAAYSGVTHYVTVGGLQPNQSYAFDILRADRPDDHAGAHWKVNTGAELERLEPDLVTGQVKNPDGSDASNVVVLATIERHESSGISAPLSTLVTESSSGSFQLDVAQARSISDLSRYLGYTRGSQHYGGDTLTVEAIGDQGRGLFTFDMGDPRRNGMNQTLAIQLSRKAQELSCTGQ